jgi:DNA-binding Xre family transcriptional regulator
VGLKLSQAEFLKWGIMVIKVDGRDNAAMKKVVTNFKQPKPRYFFKEWRNFRGYTQEELADIVGMSAPSISQLERGIQGFTDSTLEHLASALNCSPGDLLMRNPMDEDAPWSIWDNVKSADRNTRTAIVAVVETMLKTGTGGR